MLFFVVAQLNVRGCHIVSPHVWQNLCNLHAFEFAACRRSPGCLAATFGHFLLHLSMAMNLVCMKHLAIIRSRIADLEKATLNSELEVLRRAKHTSTNASLDCKLCMLARG